METTEKIIKAFEQAGKPMRPGEAAELAGVEKKDAEKAIKKLKDEGVLYSPKRCFYDLQK
ncbi:MAG: MarR family transcriptional regulator [Bacteroidales bacterium]